MLCENCKATIPTLKTCVSRVNQLLWELGTEYHSSVPFKQIDIVLRANGFLTTGESTAEGGTLTNFNACVGKGKWLHVSWHKMSSGRFEVTAYVN